MIWECANIVAEVCNHCGTTVVTSRKQCANSVQTVCKQCVNYLLYCGNVAVDGGNIVVVWR